jgi:hypothetical protein
MEGRMLMRKRSRDIRDSPAEAARGGERKLKQLVADSSLDELMLQDVLQKKS